MSKEYEDMDKEISSLLTSYALFSDDLKKLKVTLKLHVEKIFLAGKIAGIERAREQL